MKAYRMFEKSRIRIGDSVMFFNLSAYPSLHGKIAEVTGLPGLDYRYYGIDFGDGKKMAATESELEKI